MFIFKTSRFIGLSGICCLPWSSLCHHFEEDLGPGKGRLPSSEGGGGHFHLGE